MFDGHLEQEDSFVLHVLAFDHLAVATDIGDDNRFPRVITLQPTKLVVVHVTGPEGSPIAGARVWSIGSLRIGSTTSKQTIIEEYSTDADGRALVYPLPGESQLVAEKGDEVSEPWIGEHQEWEGPIDLELARSFSISGTVEDFILGTNLSDYWVTASLAEESWMSVPLSVSVVQDNGSFKDQVPWKGDASYVFRLYGPDTRPFEVRRYVAEADSRVQIAFNLRGGHEAIFLLLDEEGEPLANIPVAAVWREEGNWLYYPATSSMDGVVSFHYCPATQMWVRTYSDRYVDKPYGPYMVSVETSVVIEIVLESVGRIDGYVHLNGEPAKEFQVVVWPEDPLERHVHSFKSPDGHFEIQDAPLGLVHLAALTDSHPMGPVKQVTTTGTEVVAVELELNTAVIASGRVIDIANGKGIPGATIQVWTKFEAKFMDAWGLPITTDADGRFGRLSVSPGGSALDITAENFERKIEFLLSTEGTSTLLADIGLARSQDLVVRLVGPASTDFSGFTVVVSQAGDRAPVGVDEMGEVVLEGVNSGICRINVWTPNGERIALDTDLIPGRVWVLEIPVATERTVIVNVEPESGKPLPEDLWIEASYIGPGGHTSSRVSPVEDDRRSTFHCISGDGAVFRALDERGVYYASIWAALADAPLAEVTIRLTGKSSRLLLVDSEEKPITGAYALVMTPGDSLNNQFPIITNSAGMITLSDYGSDVIYMMVDTGGETLAITPPIHLNVDEDPIKVHLDSSSMIAARLEESGIPAESVRADLGAPGVFATFRTVTSDSEGMVRFKGLSKTSYTLRISGDGWWPSEYSLSASPEPQIQTVRVRRIGTLTTKITRLGLPLPKAELRLTSLLDDLDVSTWIEEGLISTGPSGLLSDLKGEASVHGIPAGPYRWTVLVPGLAPRQGQVEVLPLDETILDVAVE